MNMFKPTTATSPKEYIAQIDEPRKSEIKHLHELMTKNFPKLKPKIYHNIIGYGDFHYKTKSGSEGDWFILGLASQKNYISVYACVTTDGQYIAEKHKDDFPKASIGKSCIRFKKLEDIDEKKLLTVLKEAVREFKPDQWMH